ncbi:oligosaccharide flippase family protein [Gramella sp. GC03-9]|uniref:Oligosaccharide flippase family protein n=1 Tax=Christiangramia oceanisediminis TaxID=2920386 RepID=A0A9X2IAU9_9FLAO|nr:oligosaccharide flippase family protein [Gramella oceanisediminis]MCP9199338.1 oligosaccharide flippase family protein [Gramella oceanisediminis]
MSTFKKLFQQTFIYGLATVLPRMLSFLLIPLYTGVLPREEYGEISVIFAYFVLFNVILAYGMETAFFRFYNKQENKNNVLNTSGWSLFMSSILFFILAFFAREWLAGITGIDLEYINLAIWILLLDALVIIPFAWLRAAEKPMRYAIIKILNVAVNLGLNVFFLLFLPGLAENSAFFEAIYVPDFEISYVFIANVIASGMTLLLMSPFYFKLNFSFDTALWKKMLNYAFPVLIAGIAFSINEVFDRIMLDRLLPPAIAREEIGAYAACYKLALFMTLFATAFRLGIEPFFFSHAEAKNAAKTYAQITNYFVVFGSIILVGVIVFIDLLKVILIQNDSYWEAMDIVPIILLANLFLGIYHNLSVWYKITDRTRFGGYISLVGAAFTIILNLLLIPVISYTGSAIATLAAYGSMMLLSYYYGQKYYPIPYDLKKIGMYLLSAMIISGISLYLFPGNYLVGIPLLLIFITIVYFTEKEQITRIIRS